MFKVMYWSAGKLLGTTEPALAVELGLALDVMASDTPYTPIYWC